MHHFFVPPGQISDMGATVTGADVNHIKNVLRLKPGDEISVGNGVDGRDYRCGIERITDTEVFCRLRFIKEGSVELSSKVCLFQGLPKGDKMELVIQKTVELGVHEIVPVVMKRCVVRLDGKKAGAKTARWQGISEAAAKQSGRGIVPRVHEPMGFIQALEYARGMDVGIIPYEMESALDGASGMAGTKRVMEALGRGQRIAVFIGPEGGFEDDEIRAGIASGMKPVTLGRRILRTETAGMTVMAWIMYQLEE